MKFVRIFSVFVLFVIKRHSENKRDKLKKRQKRGVDVMTEFHKIVKPVAIRYSFDNVLYVFFVLYHTQSIIH